MYKFFDSKSLRMFQKASLEFYLFAFVSRALDSGLIF